MISDRYTVQAGQLSPAADQNDPTVNVLRMEKPMKAKWTFPTLALFLALAPAAYAQEVPVTRENVPAAKKPYSPYAGRGFPTMVLWGDTHLHTSNSLDARAMGATLGPEEAFRFARGDEVTSAHGERVRLSRALDFLVVADHSDAMGTMNEIVAGNPELMRNPTLRDWHERINQGGTTAVEAAVEIVYAFAGVAGPPIPDEVLDPEFVGSVWRRYLDAAEQYNDPGRFTALIGYEWTSTEGGNNLHRNVIYRDGADLARRMNPLTVAEGFNPENLWRWMATYEETTGGRVLALAHNGNLSNGLMFPDEINPATGQPLTGDYARNRIRWEPLYEITQIKGDGETHPLLSPNDEFADYGTWDKNNLGPFAKTRDMLPREYAREAFKNGLLLEDRLGTNPYKFGVVGSTDSHTSLATAEEENFFGKVVHMEPSAERMAEPIAEFTDDLNWMGWEQVASGYAAVWATENTREAIFDAMRRKEVYGTTGPRMTVRFFGGWDFEAADASNRLPGAVGYTKGVPMGGDLLPRPRGGSPTFLVAALKDPYSGNLDRIQVVKGWLDSSGETHERVYDVVWSDADSRRPGANGKLPAVGNTVDVENATWTNSIGAPELITVWEDPDFDPTQRAFYYARVLEIPTPFWTAYDALGFDVEIPAEAPRMNQERAYTSPIWYTPGG